MDCRQDAVFLTFDKKFLMITFTISERTIDIEGVIRQQVPAVYKKMPRFVFPLLRKIMHEKELNSFLYREKDKVGVDFATAILEDFGCRVEMRGMENLSEEGRYLFCANHPMGGLDGMALISRIGQIRKEILFPVNSMLLALPPLKPIFLPISKLQENTENRRSLDAAFSGSADLLYFPAGMCSRKQKGGVIADLEWKKTFVTQARKNQRDIVPVYVDGRNSPFFYNLAQWRTRLGLKMNIEQIFLVNEMFKTRNQKICLTLGRPIPFQTLDKRYSDKEWAALIKEHVYRLSKEPEAIFRY